MWLERVVKMERNGRNGSQSVGYMLGGWVGN
jgi:hypothetical protein